MTAADIGEGAVGRLDITEWDAFEVLTPALAVMQRLAELPDYQAALVLKDFASCFEVICTMIIDREKAYRDFGASVLGLRQLEIFLRSPSKTLTAVWVSSTFIMGRDEFGTVTIMDIKLHEYSR